MACSAPRASRFGSATRSIGQKYRPPDARLQRLTANRRKRPDTFDPTPAGAGSIPQLGHVTSNFPRAIQLRAILSELRSAGQDETEHAEGHAAPGENRNDDVARPASVLEEGPSPPPLS